MWSHIGGWTLNSLFIFNSLLEQLDRDHNTRRSFYLSIIINIKPLNGKKNKIASNLVHGVTDVADVMPQHWNQKKESPRNAWETPQSQSRLFRLTHKSVTFSGKFNEKRWCRTQKPMRSHKMCTCFIDLVRYNSTFDFHQFRRSHTFEAVLVSQMQFCFVFSKY